MRNPRIMWQSKEDQRGRTLTLQYDRASGDYIVQIRYDGNAMDETVISVNELTEMFKSS